MDVVRLQVNLSVKSSDALKRSSDRTGDNHTDTVNRAVQVYDYLTQLWDAGGLVFVQREAGGPYEQLTIF